MQHPPHHERQVALNISERLMKASVQSVAIHLIALYLAFEKNIELLSIAEKMDLILTRDIKLEALESPDNLGDITVADILEVSNWQEYNQRVREWAEVAWHAWSAHHQTVRDWYLSAESKW